MMSSLKILTVFYNCYMFVQRYVRCLIFVLLFVKSTDLCSFLKFIKIWHNVFLFVTFVLIIFVWFVLGKHNLGAGK